MANEVMEYKCDVCSATFKDPDDRTKHKQTVHRALDDDDEEEEEDDETESTERPPIPGSGQNPPAIPPVR